MQQTYQSLTISSRSPFLLWIFLSVLTLVLSTQPLSLLNIAPNKTINEEINSFILSIDSLVIICPQDTIISCTDNASPSTLGEASAIDYCTTNPQISFSDEYIWGICAGEEEIRRTWTVTDSCANTASCMQMIAIIDTVPPSITCPPDSTVDCYFNSDPDFPEFTYFGFPTVTDACDLFFGPYYTHTDEIIPGSCPQNKDVLRTWTARDDCGNTSECVQKIFVRDTEPAYNVFFFGPVAYVPCEEYPYPINVEFPIPFDNCDEAPRHGYEDEFLDGDCPQEKIIKRTWTAQDACGNVSSEVIQEIIFEDFYPPSISCPDDITVEYGTDLRPDAIGLATSRDNCDSNPQISFTDAGEPIDCTQGGEILRTWTAEDACGNKENCIQRILITPSTIPPLPDLVFCQGDTVILPILNDSTVDVICVRLDNLGLNAPYPVGDTVFLRCLITATCGNITADTFTVTVKPALTCIVRPSDINPIFPPNNPSEILVLYPNPVLNEINMDISVAKQGKYKITCSDVHGKRISQEILVLHEGLNMHNLQINNLPEGVYTVQIIGEETVLSRRFFKK